jgi:hypothetical protein
MHHAFFMRRFERLGNLLGDRQRLLKWEYADLCAWGDSEPAQLPAGRGHAPASVPRPTGMTSFASSFRLKRQPWFREAEFYDLFAIVDL